jgi:hypothetical protein
VCYISEGVPAKVGKYCLEDYFFEVQKPVYIFSLWWKDIINDIRFESGYTLHQNYSCRIIKASELIGTIMERKCAYACITATAGKHYPGAI